MDEKTKPAFALMLGFGLAVGALILCFNTAATMAQAFVAYAVFGVQMVAHYRLYHHKRVTAGQNELFLGMAVPTALVVQFFDHTVFSGFTVMVVAIDMLVVFRRKAAVFATASALVASIAVFAYHYGLARQGLWSAVITTFLPRFILLGTVLIARHSIMVSAQNRVLAVSLQQKADELETALATLRGYTEELKATADLRAKDQLMRALHDKLGHMLATASISAQATVSLMDRDPAAAKARLDMVCEQIQGAMKAMRSVLSGRTADTDETEPCYEQFVRLAQETQTRTGIPISIACDSAQKFNALPVALRCYLYNALMEGVTNGIRHGRATRFDCTLLLSQGQLCFRLHNDGLGFADIRYGYGLTKIENDARCLRGTLEMHGDDGCDMCIRLPVECCV